MLCYQHLPGAVTHLMLVTCQQHASDPANSTQPKSLLNAKLEWVALSKPQPQLQIQAQTQMEIQSQIQIQTQIQLQIQTQTQTQT